MKAVIRGIGSYLPDRILPNAELSKLVDTSDEWIRERTGIHQRHIAADGEYTSDLGVKAASAALEHAGLTSDDLDLIVVATSTPDFTFPATATIIQEKLGMHHGAAFDVQAVCSGFIYGSHVVNAMLKSGAAKSALLIGAVLHSYVRSDGRHREMLFVDGGPSRTQTVGHLRMLGNQVFKHAVTDIAQVMRDCADQAGVSVSEIDWFVPHQANQRILNAVARKLKLRPEQVVSTVADHANTSAASVPLAMDRAVKDGRIKRGDLVMLEAFGGGFTWGATLLRY